MSVSLNWNSFVQNWYPVINLVKFPDIKMTNKFVEDHGMCVWKTCFILCHLAWEMLIFTCF